MPNYVVIAMITYPDDQAAAQDTFAQNNARMLNSSVARIGEPGERTSYCLMGSENPDGTLTIISQSYKDIFGIVRQGTPDPNDPPAWIQPTGAQDAYPLLDVRGNPARVTYNGSTWVNTSDNNTQIPGVFGWTEEVEGGGELAGLPAWTAWTSGLNDDLYQVGDQVSHNGSDWEATTGNNYWEPGVFGWVQL